MDYMLQALSLAKLALGEVSPNPAVGAVIVKDGEVMGQGYTQPPGLSHAEIMALKQAGNKAKGGTMYVTLEPCCHYGRTPPCTKAIIESGISELHFATIDPNPLVNGKGSDALEREGIKICSGEHQEESREINEAYIKYIKTGTPFVTAKFAASLDGKIATRTGDSRWISGAESRKYVHNLRYISDAVMVGANTVLADNPQLTVRYAGVGGTAKKQPLRVIVDGKGRVQPGAKLFTEPGKVLMVVGSSISERDKQSLKQTGAELLEFPTIDGLIDLSEMLKILGKREITSVLIEGGGNLLGSLFDEGLVDKVIAFISPIIIGGQEARPAVGGCGASKIDEALKLNRVNINKFGDDFMITGYTRE